MTSEFRLFKRSLLILGATLLLASLFSVWVRDYLQRQIAEHLSQTVRNDLLIGNNAAALKILNQNLAGNFSLIIYRDHDIKLFELDSSERPIWDGITRVPICLSEEQRDCTASLSFHYSLLHYLPYVLLAGLFICLVFTLVFWLFRQHVTAYYREALKQEKEAALGRLSARICHDLKLPSMIFERVAYIEDPAHFLELRPQLQSHLQRLHAMLEKLKRVELEGLLHLETQTLLERDLRAFLASIAPAPNQLQLTMRTGLHVYLDLDKFERSLANLVLNAFQAQARNVLVGLQASQQDLIVTIENDGPPMPDDLVQAFLRPQHPRLLQSLGLRMVRDTVLAHGGRVELESGTGLTRFTLFFPQAVLVEESPPATPEIEQPTPPSTPTLIWLDADLLPLASRLVSQEEREPFFFTSEENAFERARLVISRNENAVDRAIQKAIPIIMAGNSNTDATWLTALQSRLRMLKRQLALSTENALRPKT